MPTDSYELTGQPGGQSTTMMFLAGGKAPPALATPCILAGKPSIDLSLGLDGGCDAGGLKLLEPCCGLAGDMLGSMSRQLLSYGRKVCCHDSLLSCCHDRGASCDGVMVGLFACMLI